jgi:hypothetical protein
MWSLVDFGLLFRRVSGARVLEYASSLSPISASHAGPAVGLALRIVVQCTAQLMELHFISREGIRSLTLGHELGYGRANSVSKPFLERLPKNLLVRREANLNVQGLKERDERSAFLRDVLRRLPVASLFVSL